MEKPGSIQPGPDHNASKESGRTDYVGAFVVTAGIGVKRSARKFEKDHDDYNSIMVKALAIAGGSIRRMAAQTSASRLGIRTDRVVDERGYDS